MTTQAYPYVSQLRSQGREEGRQEGRQEGREEGREEGRAEGRAEDIVRILDRRGVSAPQEARDQILSCTDIATLDSWLDRALTAAAVSDLFAPETKS
jgi:predicted transposase YdaD